MSNSDTKERIIIPNELIKPFAEFWKKKFAEEHPALKITKPEEYVEFATNHVHDTTLERAYPERKEGTSLFIVNLTEPVFFIVTTEWGRREEGVINQEVKEWNSLIFVLDKVNEKDRAHIIETHRKEGRGRYFIENGDPKVIIFDRPIKERFKDRRALFDPNFVDEVDESPNETRYFCKGHGDKDLNFPEIYLYDKFSIFFDKSNPKLIYVTIPRPAENINIIPDCSSSPVLVKDENAPRGYAFPLDPPETGYSFSLSYLNLKDHPKSEASETERANEIFSKIKEKT